MTDYCLLQFSIEAGVAHIQLNRPEKKNAINELLIHEIEDVFTRLSKDVSVVVMSGNGNDFCSGLDLAEHKSRSPFETANHSRLWHRVFSLIENSGVPVIAALQGAVIGGGLELATCAHIRIADETTYFCLPEGRHGIFVGGGASVRVARIIGAGRMAEMMLTGRVYNAADGERLGFVHYIVPKSESLSKAFEVAAIVSKNAKISNWAMVTGLSRIESMSRDDGYYTESLITALTQSDVEVTERIGSFINRKK
ncbi:crotonase/enoyl-CoA hydratase family protein [Pseudomonas sp. CES]|uniref:crotonase/enoyl-CoA hydratase family protein n=1 Tax=Pseudomonas sp. CES TaxID=2719586 RepID=UPI0014700D6B|nr:crotonase/enoyl-CoA hydratase family protein [Pseudomonas sp. CES]KAF4558103.1 crotonase/enoyl-CoA hydratase family protein [Pseudomonas sp. CES]